MKLGDTLFIAPARNYRPLGVHGQPVHSAHAQLKAALTKRFGPGHAACFSRPDMDPRDETIRWIAEFPGAARSWSTLSAEEQMRAALSLEMRRADFHLYARELREQSNDPSIRAFAAILEQAVIIPGPQHLHFIGDQPVLSFWGFEQTQGGGLNAFSLKPPSPEPAASAPPPPPPPPPPPVTPVVIARRWPVWLLWLIPLLLLLLLALGLLTWWWFWGRIPAPPTALPPPPPAVATEAPKKPEELKKPDEPPKLDEPKPLPPPDAVKPLEIKPDGVAPGVILPEGVLPGQIGPGRTGVEPGLVGPDGRRLDVAPLKPGETPLKPDLRPELKPDPKLDLRPDLKPDGKLTPDTKPPPPLKPPLLPEPGVKPDAGVKPSPLQPPTLPPSALKPDLGTRPNAGPAGRPMEIPPEAHRSGDLGFMQGEWRSRSNLIDKRTGEALSQTYRFDGRGAGQTIIRRADGVECRGAVAGAMESGRLVLREQGDVTCPDGRVYPRAETRCERTASGLTVCRGVDAQGGSYRVDLDKGP